ncbi:uncharacterized protein LOC115788735 isoform X2 [Archocentrus centrarchus]|uniref:uncharacterized protein LOC115788735 isoform X2 n=1 Tax=Archocentrus centrarchus TaxID=63155 RepID=UPI0011EA3C27|nr:uncharacterized protein LOC115788735 isoform X2 [Archocentrus centrarchus]
MMERLTWILTFFCAAGCHLSSASPVRSSTLVVQAGQNVSLPCNLTSSVDLTWYLMRSEQLLPLLTLKSVIRKNVYTTDFHTNNSRIKYEGDLQSSLVSLEIKEVEEDDAGLYFCIGRYSAAVHVSRGIQLTVDGPAGGSSTDRVKQPCLGLGLCVLPVLLALCFICMAGFYLWSGKSSACSSCNPGRRDTSHGVTEPEVCLANLLET